MMIWCIYSSALYMTENQENVFFRKDNVIWTTHPAFRIINQGFDMYLTGACIRLRLSCFWLNYRVLCVAFGLLVNGTGSHEVCPEGKSGRVGDKMTKTPKNPKASKTFGRFLREDRETGRQGDKEMERWGDLVTGYLFLKKVYKKLIQVKTILLK